MEQQVLLEEQLECFEQHRRQQWCRKSCNQKQQLELERHNRKLVLVHSKQPCVPLALQKDQLGHRRLELARSKLELLHSRLELVHKLVLARKLVLELARSKLELVHSKQPCVPLALPKDQRDHRRSVLVRSKSELVHKLVLARNLVLARKLVLARSKMPLKPSALPRGQRGRRKMPKQKSWT
jgi:hypothetical protein